MLVEIGSKMADWRPFCFRIKNAKQCKNMQELPMLCSKYGLVWNTEHFLFSLLHFQYGGQAAILENIQWAISPEP
jgi:hypothetical protein